MRTATAGDRAASLRLPCDCLCLAAEGLDDHASVVAAQRKLTKARRLYLIRVMRQNQENALTCSLNYARVALGGILSGESKDFLEGQGKLGKQIGADGSPAPTQRRKTTSEGEEGAGGDDRDGGADGLDKIEVIDLPRPMSQLNACTPFKAVAYVRNVADCGAGRHCL